MTQDKSHMFWTDDPNIAYADGIPIPRVTYRCKGAAQDGKLDRTTGQVKPTGVKHSCKLVTDHPTDHCLCICGQKFNEREESHA